MPSRCILYDRLNEKVYVGYFERPGKKGDGRYDERSMTAHEKMARAAKIEKLQCIGASISTYDGERTYTLNLNSNTINAAWALAALTAANFARLQKCLKTATTTRSPKTAASTAARLHLRSRTLCKVRK